MKKTSFIDQVVNMKGDMHTSEFTQQFVVRWSDVDPNGHLRGSVYMEYGAHTRLAYMQSKGVNNRTIQKPQIGPILFNVNVAFKKEVYMNDTVTVNCKLDYLSEDGRKWGIIHEMFNGAGDLVSVVKAEGAWMDLKIRKVVAPPPDLKAVLQSMPSKP